MDDLIQEFLAETTESLAELDLDIVKLEQNPNDKNLLGKIFRLVHTIKGTCGFLGLPRLETVAHRAENVLGRFRDGTLFVTPQAVTLILASLDRIKLIVSGLAESGAEPQGDDSALIAELDAMYEGKTLDDTISANISPPIVPQTSSPTPIAEADEHGFVPVMADYSEIGIDLPSTPPPAEPVIAEDSTPPAKAESIAHKEPVASKDTPAAKESAKESDVSATSLRVNVDVLENLMNMVSELVLTRNQLMQILRGKADSEFAPPLQRLSQVVSELQEGVMQTRMQPIGNAWSKLPRIIRDISVELGKKINLEMRGKETELDRQVLDLIKDPLTHMVRNSADHGIEKPTDRLAVGKPEEGTVLLNAFHEGGHIIIEISDDGKGLPIQKIRAKIVEKGLATEDEVKAMTNKQIQQYIFHAGLSTAEKITSVSGRGVGMDVVRSNIEKIGGTIEMNSVEGKGTTFTIKIPLTLAIVSALIVEVGPERYAIPQISVQELVRVSEKSDLKIENIKGAPVMRLRDRLLPLVSLRRLLNVDNEPIISGYIVVSKVGSFTFGIVVDRVFDTEEIVVKPISPLIRGVELYGGNTILGDGSVIMILDPNGVAKTVGEVSAMSEVNHQTLLSHEQAQAHKQEKTSLLVFKAGNNTPKAVPLSLVARLEEVDPNKVEQSGGQHVIQYRGQLMPLVFYDQKMSFRKTGHQLTLVFVDHDRSMGLMVDDIIDIVEETLDVQMGGAEAGVIGSAIIKGQAMDVIDVGHFLSVARGDWFRSKNKLNPGLIQKQRVLLVDDSSFFRDMLTPMLSVAGYDVVTVTNAEEAMTRLEHDSRFDVIVSDIEMPGMSGYEFVSKLKQNQLYASIPVFALSAHANPDDIAKGKSAGFDEYIPKFDREALVNAIHRRFAKQEGRAA